MLLKQIEPKRRTEHEEEKKKNEKYRTRKVEPKTNGQMTTTCVYIVHCAYTTHIYQRL